MLKSLISGVVLSPRFQASLLGSCFRRLVMATRPYYKYSAHFLTDIQGTKRPHYSYCMLNAAILAKSLGLDRISAIEFGVAGGNGLAFMVYFAEEIKRTLGVTVDCYGFDTGKGMPPPEGPLDLPFWFQETQYAMNQDALRAAGLLDKVVLGNVADTAGTFVKERKPAPIGAIFNDLDYWSSTRDSLKLFDARDEHPECYLPRCYIYLDDVIGNAVAIYGPCNGQLAAIEESNAARSDLKIHLNQNLLLQNHVEYRNQIYYAHLFNHPRYSDYVGARLQAGIEEALSFKGRNDAV